MDGAGGGAAGESRGAGVVGAFFELRKDGGGGGLWRRVGLGVGISRGFSAAAEEDGDCAYEAKDPEGDTDGDADRLVGAGGGGRLRGG